MIDTTEFASIIIIINTAHPRPLYLRVQGDSRMSCQSRLLLIRPSEE